MKTWADKQLYHLYIYMLKRCFVSTTPHYHRYGGRGITVCERWRIGVPRGQGFRNFKSDVGPRPKGYSLDRTDNDGNYCPENCKWVPRAQQYRNRSTNVWVTHNGQKSIIKDLATAHGIRDQVLKNRLRIGIPMELALQKERLPHIVNKAMIDAAAAEKRSRTHCKRGHEFTEANTHINKHGFRVCRACKREYQRDRRK